MSKEESVISHPYNFKLLPVGRISVNHLYQRDPVDSTIKNIVGEFDYHKVNAIKCIFRDGNYFAFDGQNTAIGLTMLFGAKYLAPVLIYDDIETAEEEAKLFGEINSRKFRKAATVADDLKAKLFMRDEEATIIRKIAKENGFEFAVGENKGKSGTIPVAAYTYLKNIYAYYGKETLSEVIAILGGAWIYDKYGFKKPIIKGLVVFVKAYNGMYNRSDLINRLHRNSAKDLFNQQQNSKDRTYKVVAREILAIYNKNTTVNRLPDRI